MELIIFILVIGAIISVIYFACLIIDYRRRFRPLSSITDSPIYKEIHSKLTFVEEMTDKEYNEILDSRRVEPTICEIDGKRWLIAEPPFYSVCERNAIRSKWVEKINALGGEQIR